MAHISDFDRPKKAAFVKKRFLIAFLATLCTIVCYISRQNLSMARVAMAVDKQPNETLPVTTTDSNNNASAPHTQSANHLLPATRTFDTCPEPMVVGSDGKAQRAPKVETYGPKYDWEQSERNLLLEAFFWTYVFFQIPAARVAEVVGAKWILAAAGIGSSLLSLLSPWAASQSVYGLALIRGLMGICQAALFPACYVLYAQWLPPLERSQALPILCVGAYVGSIVASTSTGYFSEQPSLGWEMGFYMPAALCAIWSLLWLWMGTSEPRQHSSISLEELEYIESKLEIKRTSMNGGGESGSSSRKDIDWMKLLKSQHIWAMMVAFFASNWSFSIVLLLLPDYLNDILHIPPLSNGMINSVIYILYCISSPLVGSISTMMAETRSCGLSRLSIRKLFQCTALFGQAICFVALPIIGCDTTAVLGLLFVQIVLFSFVNGGEVQLPSELSVDFSGTIYAIGNCVGSSTGFIVPKIHSLIVESRYDRSQWDLYFYVAASITALGGLLFLIFGKNDLQDFSKNLGESQLDICKRSQKGSIFNLESQPTTTTCRSWRPREASE